MKTDTSEKGLEALIVDYLTDDNRPVVDRWIAGKPEDYDRSYATDLVQLRAFVAATQPTLIDAFDLYKDSPTRQKFLARLQGEITKYGVIHVLRHGVKHGPHSIDLFYGTPTPGNTKAEERYAANRFSVTRQLRYSLYDTMNALDVGLFINGLPIATFELKNSLTKQTVADAIEQYKRDRNPRELIFQFGRCIAHFAIDDVEVRFCTQLRGGASWFLPFNKGWNDGAGNPPNPHGLKTDYFWKQTLDRKSLTNIIENYAQIVEVLDKKTGRKKREQIFPRYHQFDVVRKLLAHVSQHAVGKRYLIEHSAGSGKSNSIAWLAHQLVGLKLNERTLFESIIVVTDRRLLDDQLHSTIKNFIQVGATVGHADHSGDLRKFIESGRRSSSRPCRNFLLYWTRLAANIATGRLPSSSTRHTQAKAGRPRLRSALPSRRQVKRRKRKHLRTKSTGSWRRRSCCPMPAISHSRQRRRTRRWNFLANPIRAVTGPSTDRSTATR
jgi:type I restriction enzyme R subunit